MTDWISGSLDDLCEVEYGTRVTRKRDGGTMYPVYGGGGATFNLDDFNRQDQMIISRFAMSEECVRFVPGKFFLNDSGLTVRTRDASLMLQEFLDQQLLAKSSEIYLTARGTAQKNMDMTMFRGMELTFPDSLEEQKRIVALLDDTATHITELTTCYEQAWTHVNNLFTSTLRNAMESNPDWPMKTLGEVCEVARGTSITRKQTKEGSIPVVAGGIDVAYFHSVHNRPAGTITISSSGANAGFVNRWDVPIFASDCSTVVAKEGGLVIGEYAFRFLQFKQGFINDELRRGAAQPHVYAKDIAAIEITVPPLEEQKRIVARLDQVRAKASEMVTAYDDKLQAMKDFRQSILEAAFSGEL